LPGSDKRFEDIADIWELPCPDTVQAVESLRNRIGKAAVKETQRQRKERVRVAKEKHAPSRSGPAKRSWDALKPFKEDPITSLPDGKGGHTSNYNEMHALTYEDWATVLFREDMPDVGAWRQKYMQYIPEQPRYERARLTGEGFKKRLRRVSVTGATGTDGMRVKEALDLPIIFLDWLARIFEGVERGGEWPEPLC